jgi:hypothetical protein
MNSSNLEYKNGEPFCPKVTDRFRSCSERICFHLRENNPPVSDPPPDFQGYEVEINLQLNL